MTLTFSCPSVYQHMESRQSTNSPWCADSFRIIYFPLPLLSGRLPVSPISETAPAYGYLLAAVKIMPWTSVCFCSDPNLADNTKEGLNKILADEVPIEVKPVNPHDFYRRVPMEPKKLFWVRAKGYIGKSNAGIAPSFSTKCIIKIN